MAGPPPVLRDDRLTLDQLGRMTREFDELSAASRVDCGRQLGTGQLVR